MPLNKFVAIIDGIAKKHLDSVGKNLPRSGYSAFRINGLYKNHIMSIQHALLTSLLEKPSSGYELARRFDKSMGYFWSATHQQIYRELGRMAEAGWLSVEEE